MSTYTPKIGFVSLGCPKALVDSEKMITQLRQEGYTIVPSYPEADLVIVNTCGFINSAIEESLDAIGEALDAHGKVIVMGCLGAKKDTILQQHPKVLHISGPDQNCTLLEAIHEHLPPPPQGCILPAHGIKLTPPHYAYLKISEGCNHHCTYCIVPQLRGKLVSRPIDEVLREAENLTQAGVKELLIIAQDTAAYGQDLQHKPCTQYIDLVEALSTLNVWVRLHYLYPYPHIDQLIPMMTEGKVLPYLDIPLQHAHPTILRWMKRPAHTENILERIAQWRNICPDITIRSTFMTGFPGETDAMFQHLLDFLQAAQLDRVGCFAYSPVEGAAANALPNPVPEDVKEERLAALMALQADISANKLKDKIGHEMTVLVDSVEESHAIARSPADAPDIDGLVIIEDTWQSGTAQPSTKTNTQHIKMAPSSIGNLHAGNFAKVIIKDSDTHDLYAMLAPSKDMD